MELAGTDDRDDLLTEDERDALCDLDTENEPPEYSEPSDRCIPPNEEDEHVAATVYTSGKDKKAVLQAEHYAKRGHKLIDYSLYEYGAIIKIVPIAKPTRRTVPSGSEAASDGDELVTGEDQPSLGSMQGRTRNITFRFHPSHPLHETHQQQIRSKFKVPVLIKTPPKPPPPRPSHPDEAWRKMASSFAQYNLVVFRPWLEADGTLPGTLSWTSLCAWMKDIEFGVQNMEQGGRRFGQTVLDRARKQWVENASQG